MNCPAPQRRWRPTALDVSLATGFATLDTVLTLSGAAWWPHHPSSLAWTLLAIQAVACLTLAVQRRAPLTVVAVLGGFTLAVTLLIAPAHVLVPQHDNNVWAPYATILAAYAPILGASSPWRAFVAVRGLASRPRWLGFAAVLALTIVVCRPWQPSAAVITIGISRTAVGPLLAMYLDARRRLIRAVAEQARAAERANLAGEMHDLVTRHVTLMVMQAGALRVAADQPEVIRTAEELRVTGCRALDELRDLVGVLPSGTSAAAPHREPAELVAEAVAAGAPATLDVHGDPGLASPIVARTLGRIVAEGLTNVRKHAPGAVTRVDLSYGPAAVHVAVRNAAPSRAPDAGLVATGSGVGLAGLRRRVELVDGELHAGPLPEGGFELAATLPAFVPTGDRVSA
ncbi:MAG TPA: histidine kinase [Jatrophihabitantaceae bacterium]|jgi:signal transduction histidine kinase